MTNIFRDKTAISRNGIGNHGFGFLQQTDITKPEIFVTEKTFKRAGFNPKDIKQGDVIDVEYEVLKDGRLRAVWIFAVNGKKAPNDRSKPAVKVRAKSKPSGEKPAAGKKAVSIGNHYIGEVITYFDDKGYGFIQPLGGKYKAAFFHVSQMLFGDLPTEGARYHFTGVDGRVAPAAGDLFTADGVTSEEYCRLVGEEGSYVPEVVQEDDIHRKQVDKNDEGDKLVKVTKRNRLVHFEVERANNSGTVILKGVNSLAEARKKIGKTIKHPTAANHGQSTNDPSVSKGMKNAPSKKKEAA